MRLARWIFVALFAVMLLLPQAWAEGRDELYVKPDDQKSWSERLADLVGYQGFSRSYALVIGINDYTSGYPPLPTGKDPIRMSDFLQNEAGFDYVHILTNEKATGSRIRELMLEVFPKLIDANDRFLFYWSGHGDQQPNARGGYEGYLPLANSRKGQYSTMVSMGDIRRWDDLLKARHALFLLDACFSGLAGSVDKSPTRDLKIDQLMHRAHHLIAAGTGEQATIASDRWGGSIFTDSILLGASGEADSFTPRYPPDGVVSLNELIEWVQTRVAREKDIAGWTKTITPQIRDLRGSSGQFFFLPKKSEEVGPDNAEAEGQPIFLSRHRKAKQRPSRQRSPLYRQRRSPRKRRPARSMGNGTWSLISRANEPR